MATTLDTLVVELFMNSSAFAAQSKGVEKALNGIKTAAQATGLVVAAMFVKSGISQFVSQAQELGNLSRSVRENAEDLQAWGEAVKREGGTVEGFNSTVKKLSDDLMSIPLTGGNRFLLLVKAMANISNCTVPNLEEILNYLFQERGKVYVFDTGMPRLNSNIPRNYPLTDFAGSMLSTKAQNRFGCLIWATLICRAALLTVLTGRQGFRAFSIHTDTAMICRELIRAAPAAGVFFMSTVQTIRDLRSRAIAKVRTTTLRIRQFRRFTANQIRYKQTLSAYFFTLLWPIRGKIFR